MSAFKIGGSPFRPTSEITAGKKTKAKETAQPAAPTSRGAFDTASINPNRLAVMPRMSSIGSGETRQLGSETVESALRDNAAALDDYFSRAYGFKD